MLTFFTGDPVKEVIEKEGVPAIFFDQNFDLSKRKTFSEIFPPSAIATSLLLQEKVQNLLNVKTYYCD
jgi:hypothetical protein